MKNAVQTIITKLDELFIPMDIKVLADTQEWAKGRCAALKELPNSDRYKEVEAWGWKYAANLYEMKYAVCGGKMWYQIFKYGYSKSVEAFVIKNCEATAAKRNAKIAKKLEAAGVTEIVESVFTNTKDGFNGVFVVETNAGKKKVIVDTIYAGGYNIQCLHLRVLVKVK